MHIRIILLSSETEGTWREKCCPLFTWTCVCMYTHDVSPGCKFICMCVLRAIMSALQSPSAAMLVPQSCLVTYAIIVTPSDWQMFCLPQWCNHADLVIFAAHSYRTGPAHVALTSTWSNYQWLCVCMPQCLSWPRFGSLSSKALWSTPTLATSPPSLTGVAL